MQLTSDFSCQTLDVTVSAPDKRVRSNARHAIQTGYFVGILVPLSTFWRKKKKRSWRAGSTWSALLYFHFFFLRAYPIIIDQSIATDTSKKLCQKRQLVLTFFLIISFKNGKEIWMNYTWWHFKRFVYSRFPRSRLHRFQNP